MKLKTLLNELQAELVGGGMVVINGKKYAIQQLPPNAQRIVNSVTRFIGKNMKAFTKYDLTNWDIQTKADGTVLVTDDNGKKWSFKL